jgi:16S rRNA (cytosine967-C5)-methyltransferase
MKKSVRHLACDILCRINISQAFASDLLDETLRENELSGTPDGRLLTHLVYGVLRLRGHLDWLVAAMYRGDFANMPEEIKNILRLGIYQLKFSDRLPAFAVVDEAVKVTKLTHPAQSGLVNAILRNYLRRGAAIKFPSLEKNPASYLAAFHSHPLWLVQEWLKLFGVKETLALCSANNEQPPLTLRVNTLKISREELQQKLGAEGFDSTATAFSPDGLIIAHTDKPLQKTDFFSQGLFRIQDEGSQLISRLAFPKINENILDVCAGSGGKTTHLAALLQNTGKITAIDQSREKISQMHQESARLGITNIETVHADLNVQLPESLQNQFDLVLVDAPCSGTGTLRRNPEIKWRTTSADINKLTARQKNILHNSSLAVKKGGRLLYCTCSALPQENEDIIEHFLSNNAQFSVWQPSAPIFSRFINDKGFFHTLPHLHHMDGFFGAALVRQ